MNFKTIRTNLVLVLSFLALSVSLASVAQQNNSRNQKTVQPQTNTKNERALREIEMMKEVVSERREQQAQQHRVLQELQKQIEGKQGGEYYSANPEPQTAERVTSGSVLSQIDHQERQELKQLEQQYLADMRKADREIDFLREQLEITNRQLDQCQIMTTTNSRRNSPPQVYEPAQQAKSQVAKKTVRAKNTAQHTKSFKNERFITDTPQQQAPAKLSEADMKAMREIEAMKKELRMRREKQQAQQQLLEDLKQQFN